jgi:uncharacterized protein UPF0236
MGAAEVISFEEVRARKQWDALRRQLHTSFDQWLDGLEAQLQEPAPTLAQVTETVWNLRQELTGGLTQTIVEHTHLGEHTRKQVPCPQCNGLLTARAPVPRTVETLVGPVELERPYFYCRACRRGVYPLDEALDLVAGRTQLDVQKVAAKLVTAVPYDEAHTLLSDLPGVSMGSERMHTCTNQVAVGLTVVDVAPSREEIEQRIAAVAAGSRRRPVLVLGIDGAYVPMRPDSARGRRPGQGRHRATRPRWQGEWHDAKGFRLYLMDGERIVHLLSWHQGQNERELGEALKQVKEAGVIPEDQVRLCVVADGAPWIWKHVKALFAHARQVLDYDHCADDVHNVAKTHYGASGQALEWAEATMTRLYVGKVSAVLGGLRRMQAQSAAAEKVIANCWDYLNEHREHTDYRKCRRGGYPLGSGGIESSNKFICHVRLKRSGAWGYEVNSHQMLALRCAKYNGTLDQVFARYKKRLRETSE